MPLLLGGLGSYVFRLLFVGLILGCSAGFSGGCLWVVSVVDLVFGLWVACWCYGGTFLLLRFGVELFGVFCVV